MNIYFARTIRGDHVQGDGELHKWIVSTIRQAGHRPQFDLPVQIPRIRRKPEQYIYKRDLAWIDQCHAMIAELSSASHGVGYEIAYATLVRQIPVFCICDAGQPVSAMIQGHLDVFYYRDLGDLTAHLRTVLEEVKKATPVTLR